LTLWQIKYILFSSQRQKKKISNTFYLLKVWLVVSGNVLFKKIDSISFFKKNLPDHIIVYNILC